MSDPRLINDDHNNDHRHGRYLLSGSDSLDGEELNTFIEEAIANRRLRIAGHSFDPLLRELTKESATADKQRQCFSNERKQGKSKIGTADVDVSGKNNNGTNTTKASYGQESWGRDSGARDLSPEPSMHQRHHRHLAELNAIDGQMTENEANGSTSMMHLANKLQVAAITALKTEVLELSTRLQQSNRERDSLQRNLNELIEEKDQANRRLDAISSSHESRITEMHCIIVELSKKLKAKQDNAIMEENEPEGSVSELSFQEGSIYNSEMECTNIEQDTEPLDIKLVQPMPKADSPSSLPPPPIVASAHFQIQTMQEEILHLRGQVAYLQSQLASDRDRLKSENIDGNIETTHLDNEHIGQLTSPRERSNYTSDDLCETAEIFDQPSNPPGHEIDYIRHSMAKYTKTHKVMLPASRGVSPIVQTYGSINSLNNKTQLQQQKSVTAEMPVSKMAERVRLRRTIEEDRITGPDITNTGICSTEIAEHLVSDLLQSDMVNGDINEMPLDALHAEIQRLQRRIEHLRIQNTVLSISLSESKSHCDHLYLLCGKYESNAIALNQALNCSDRAIEAYDVMLALLESRLGLLEDCDANDKVAEDGRKAAEAVAQHLLNRLDSETNYNGNSMGPWQEAVVISSHNSSTKPWTSEEDIRLRNHVSKLKGQRAIIQNTVVVLESPFCLHEMDQIDMGNHSRSSGDSSGKQRHNDNRRMDLETAVLMQELMSMRENLGEYKYQAEQAEREKNLTLERVSVMREALLHLQTQLADSEALLAMSNKDRTSYSEAEHAAGIERELVEALARESRLKARLQGLAGSLEVAAKSSEEKYAQVQNTVSELKQANVSLTHSLDRCKRKYQSRLRRLEQQMQDLSLTKKSIQQSGAIQSPMSTVPETTL